MAFLDNSPRSADVMALDKVTCLVVTRPWFTSLADTLPHLKIKLLMSLIREVSSRLRQANVEITALQRS
jgi:glutaminase